MSRIQPHTLESAPVESRPLLERFAQTSPTGRLLNIHGAMARSPLTIGMYAAIRHAIQENSVLEPKAQWAVILAVGAVNEAPYSQAVYALLAKQRGGLSDDQIRTITEGGTIDDPKLDPLLRVARELAQNSGHVTDFTWNAARAAGWSEEDLIALFPYVVLGIYVDYFESYAEVESDLTAPV